MKYTCVLLAMELKITTSVRLGCVCDAPSRDVRQAQSGQYCQGGTTRGAAAARELAASHTRPTVETPQTNNFEPLLLLLLLPPLLLLLLSLLLPLLLLLL